jgi:outer membrane protein OmpA-like peptidoglycan-associated protein
MNKDSILRFVLAGLLVLSGTFCTSPDKKDPPTEETTEETSEKPAVTDADAKAEKTDRSKETKEEPEPTANLGYAELLDELNSRIADVRYPDGESLEGFEYKKWEIPNRKEFQSWLKDSASVIQDALEKLPASIKLEIVGHADTTGPENREGSKMGNIYYSKKRAEEVKKFIVKVFKDDNTSIKNLEERILTKGVGSAEPIAGIEGSSAKNRRVTFKLIDKTSEEGPSPGASENDSDIDSTK